MRSIVLCVALLSSLAATAQVLRTTESIDVSLVNVDVVVTDKDGRRVTGLTADDFEVREGGELQPITNFSEYRGDGVSDDAAPQDGASRLEPAASRPPRTIVLFFEPMRMSSAQASEIFDALREMLRSTVVKNDRVMIVLWDAGRLTSVVRQPFTDDIDTLADALVRIQQEYTRGRPPGHADQFLRDRRQALIDAERLEEEGAGWMQAVGGGDSASPALEQLHAIKRKSAALRGLMSSISAFEGRKIVIMLMHRFGAFAGAEYFAGGKVDEEWSSKLETADLQELLVRTANANDITIYPVHPPDMGSSGISASRAGSFGAFGGFPEEQVMNALSNTSVLQNELIAQQNLAVKTGGIATWGPASIARMLPTIREDLESYYSLAYRATGVRTDSARPISVRTKDPRYTVRARRQVVEKSDTTKMTERLMANLHGYLDDATIPVDVQFGTPAAKRNKRWQVPLEITFPIKALTIVPEGRNSIGSFSVYVMVDTMSGEGQAHRQMHSFKIPANKVESAKSSVFTYDFVLEVDAKAKIVSVGVVDETTKTFGLARTSLPEVRKR